MAILNRMTIIGLVTLIVSLYQAKTISSMLKFEPLSSYYTTYIMIVIMVLAGLVCSLYGLAQDSENLKDIHQNHAVAKTTYDSMFHQSNFAVHSQRSEALAMLKSTNQGTYTYIHHIVILPHYT